MAKKTVLLALCCVCIGLAACGTENDDSDVLQSSKAVSATQTEQTGKPTEDTEGTLSEQTGETDDVLTAESANAAVTEQTTAQTEETLPDQTEDTTAEQNENASDTLTEAQALEAIENYCFINDPDLKSKVDSGEYEIYWQVSTNEGGEIVVLYRSYTAAQIRYYVDPASGGTYVTELVPGIIDEEQRTDESFNVRDYLV
ncbi:MAG: hypothetical protein IJ555_02360 [Ruminococcus sp.]|nr:hypothetical protein [Ruminococcus sp.]